MEKINKASCPVSFDQLLKATKEYVGYGNPNASILIIASEPPIYAVFSPQNAGFRPICSRIHNIEGALTTYILAIEKNTPPLQSKSVVY